MLFRQTFSTRVLFLVTSYWFRDLAMSTSLPFLSCKLSFIFKCLDEAMWFLTMQRRKLTSCRHASQNNVRADTVRHSLGNSLTRWDGVTDLGLLEHDGRFLRIPCSRGLVNIFLFLVSDFLGPFNRSNKETTVLLLASDVVVSRSPVVFWSSSPKELSSESVSTKRSLLGVLVLPQAVAPALVPELDEGPVVVAIFAMICRDARGLLCRAH